MEVMTSTQMAELYGLPSSIAFNKLMVQCGILVHNNDGYVLADNLRGQGYTTVINARFFLPNGARASKKKAAWTGKGRLFVQRHLRRLGIVPSTEQNDLFAQTSN